MTDLRQQINAALADFATQPFAQAATGLFAALGYQSDRTLPDQSGKPADFLRLFPAPGTAAWESMALRKSWQSVYLLFQYSGAEIESALLGPNLFGASGLDRQDASSFLFLAVDLLPPKDKPFTRTDLAGVTRALNRLFPMPCIVLFRHGDTLTLAAVERRPNRLAPERDVLEKVSLVRDIAYTSPHAAHVLILGDLALNALLAKSESRDFAALHAAWGRALDSSLLNNRFFRELADWYFWAVKHTVFPDDAGPTPDVRNATSVIRLLTRLIFCWFVKEKGLLPPDLFNARKVARALSPDFAPDGRGTIYYKAILQNLFFATLNQEMGDDPQGRPLRRFRTAGQHFMAHTLYRYRALFRDPATALDLFRDIPFLNGGLFECLDRTEDLPGGKQHHIRMDGFSDREDNPLSVPDFLFFGPATHVDLSEAYGDARFAGVKVRGLLEIFDSYKFTVTENTPIEEEVALDPELLGRVFENLLAAYNPETSNTARKQTGSFYTPRNIVDYMVEQSLLHALHARYAERVATPAGDFDERLERLLAYTAEPPAFSKTERTTLIDIIDRLQILDPACGSGAFPMGMLHKLVHVLGRLDPHNALWKERQIARVAALSRQAAAIEDPALRDRIVADLDDQRAGIEEAFERNELDYGRKLFLIENGLFGVDIQPIAVQIAKLRCFISLVVNQRPNPAVRNLGIRPLPNLETKFVAANALLGVAKPEGWLPDQGILGLEKELRDVRHRHFSAKRPADKTACRLRDRELRRRIAEQLQGPRLEGRAHRLAAATLKILAKTRRVRCDAPDAAADLYELLRDARRKFSGLAEVDVPAPARERIVAIEAMFQDAGEKVRLHDGHPGALARLVKEIDNKSGGLFDDLLNGTGFPAETARMLAAWDPYDQNAASAFFDSEWMFGVSVGAVSAGSPAATLRGSFGFVNDTPGQMELAGRDTGTATGGFDITIGNPPYVRADEPSESNRAQRAAILESGVYETLWEKWDLFVPFIERAYKLLRPGGVSTLIVSDAFCHAKYAQKPQDWFLRNARILRLDFCADLKIFDAAVHNLITCFQKADGKDSVPERRLHSGEFGNVTLLPSDMQPNLTCRAFFPEEEQGRALICDSVELGNLCYISYGLAASSDEKLYKGEFVTDDVVQDTADDSHPKRYIEGKEIKQWVTHHCRFLEWGTERAPDKFRRKTFLELHEATEKLMTIVVTGGEPPVMFDDMRRFTTHTSCIFVPWHMLSGVRNNSLKKAARYADEKPPRPDLPRREGLEETSRRFAVKYLLAVMNSSVARDFLRANRRSNIHLYPDDWKRLPVPDADAAAQAPIVALVDRILAARRADPKSDIAALEQEVDGLVSHLYGISRTN